MEDTYAKSQLVGVAFGVVARDARSIALAEGRRPTKNKVWKFWIKLTANDIAHRVGVCKGFEYEFRGAALVHCETFRRRGVLGWLLRMVETV